jgi:hypothetical protein
MSGWVSIGKAFADSILGEIVISGFHVKSEGARGITVFITNCVSGTLAFADQYSPEQFNTIPDYVALLYGLFDGILSAIVDNWLYGSTKISFISLFFSSLLTSFMMIPVSWIMDLFLDVSLTVEDNFADTFYGNQKVASSAFPIRPIDA